MNEEEESAMLLGSIYGDLAGLMQEDAPAPTEPIHFNPFFDHFCHCGHRVNYSALKDRASAPDGH